MERPHSGVETQPSRAAIAGNMGTPMAVAITVGLALAMLILIRSGFRGAVITYGG